MRLSLRTLLAYEDKVFDIEQQRQLDKLIRQDDASVLTLRRIRGIVRQPHLGVPGRIQQREELDPNVVAEYIDEEMQSEVQGRFEKFCLSSDKFLAEIASVHQILSNVLGEPARTSRECRLRCYGANRRKAAVPRAEPEAQFFEPEPAAKPEVILQRSVEREFPVKAPVDTPAYFQEENYSREELPHSQRAEPCSEYEERHSPKVKPEEKEEKKNSLAFWGFIVMLVFPAGFLLGLWLFPTFYEADGVQNRSVSTERPPMVLPPQQSVPVTLPAAENSNPKVASPSSAKETKTAVYTGTGDASAAQIGVADADKKTVVQAVLQMAPPFEWAKQEEPIPETESQSPVIFLPPPESYSAELASAEETPPEPVPPAVLQTETFDPQSLIAFQPITAPPVRQKVIDFDAQRRLEVPRKANRNRRAVREHAAQDSVIANVPVPAQKTSEWSSASKEYIPPETATLSEAQSLAIVEQITEAIPAVSVEKSEKSVGRVPPRTEPAIIFSANSSSDPWDLEPQPFNVFPEQYLLTLAPFRTELEWENGLLIEMVGDTKLCVLPPDENGTSGIYVDYGRIVVRQKTSEQDDETGQPRSLRIQTENVEGVLHLSGKKSSAFIDTFAEVQETGISESGEPLPNDNKSSNKIVPILGLLPETGCSILWQVSDRQEPVSANQNSSVKLLAGGQGLGGLQVLPAWLQRQPLPKEAEAFSGICRRVFSQYRGDCKAALEELSRDTSPLVRSFGLRLWGDLGRFDIPFTFLEKAGRNDDSVREVLVSYFREAAKRDSESVQRLSDAMEAVRRTSPAQHPAL